VSVVNVQLFGKLRIRCDEQDMPGFEAHKVQELFCYLLLHRDQPHPREALADLLWEGASTAQSKKYLRQALWQVQSALSAHANSSGETILLVESDWISLRHDCDLRLDVAVFEEAFARARETPGVQLDHDVAQSLEVAARLYQGDLLGGWYHDWCLFERERLQNVYIAMLNKLIAYCDAHHRHDAGLAYAERILRLDSARESTHRWMMRLYYQMGERTEALRQYKRCVAALDQALSIQPSARTTAMYHQIRADRAYESSPTDEDPPLLQEALDIPNTVLGRLQRLRLGLGNLERQLGQEIEAIERGLTPASSVGGG
jgi:DNA-binding SARP family transcriptional activator